MNLYAVYDQVAKVHGAPVMCPNDELMIRDFKSGIQSGKLRYPSDQALVRLGSFDQESGAIVSDPVFICSGEECMNDGR